MCHVRAWLRRHIRVSALLHADGCCSSIWQPCCRRNNRRNCPNDVERAPSVTGSKGGCIYSKGARAGAAAGVLRPTVSCAHRSRTSRSWAASATWPSSSCRGRCRCWQRGRSPSRRSRATPAPCAASSTRPRRPSTGENPSHLASRFAHSAVRPWAASSTRRRRPSTGGASPIPSASSICPFHSTSAGLGHRARRRQLAAQTIYRWVSPQVCVPHMFQSNSRTVLFVH